MTWQPIDTAPKDGTKVLLWRDGWRQAPVAQWRASRAEDEADGWLFVDDMLCLGHDSGFLGWSEDIEDDYMPTHWAPVPE